MFPSSVKEPLYNVSSVTLRKGGFLLQRFSVRFFYGKFLISIKCLFACKEKKEGYARALLTSSIVI